MLYAIGHTYNGRTITGRHELPDGALSLTLDDGTTVEAWPHGGRFPADFGHADDIDLQTAQQIAATLDPGKGSASLRCDGTVEGAKADNDLRAAWGLLGLSAYVERTFGKAEDEPFETLLPDLISDLLHLCDAVHLDVDDALSKARRQYDEEVTGTL